MVVGKLGVSLGGRIIYNEPLWSIHKGESSPYSLNKMATRIPVGYNC